MAIVPDGYVWSKAEAYLSGESQVTEASHVCRVCSPCRCSNHFNIVDLKAFIQICFPKVAPVCRVPSPGI